MRKFVRELVIGDVTPRGTVEAKLLYGPWVDVTFVRGRERYVLRRYGRETIEVVE